MIIVTYQTGESRSNPGEKVDYMAGINTDLYAEEKISPDRLEESGEWKPGAEDESRERLKKEIIRQAEEQGINPDDIRWN